MRYVLILLGLLMYANVAEAIDCKTPPDCAELGYSKYVWQINMKDGRRERGRRDVDYYVRVSLEF